MQVRVSLRLRFVSVARQTSPIGPTPICSVKIVGALSYKCRLANCYITRF